MTTFQIILAIIALPLVSVVIEKLLMAFWKWIRRDRKVKEFIERIVQLEEKIKIQEQELVQHKDHKRIQEDLEIYRQAVYKSKSTGETYCIACFDGSGKLIHAVHQNTGYYCGICDKFRCSY